VVNIFNDNPIAYSAAAERLQIAKEAANIFAKQTIDYIVPGLKVLYLWFKLTVIIKGSAISLESIDRYSHNIIFIQEERKLLTHLVMEQQESFEHAEMVHHRLGFKRFIFFVHSKSFTLSNPIMVTSAISFD
jgi:hypothetical protein